MQNNTYSDSPFIQKTTGSRLRRLLSNLPAGVVKRYLFLVAVTLATLPAFAQNNPLVGAWRLTAADKILPDGNQVADYGVGPHGMAVFTADGHYVVEIFKANRPKITSTDRTGGTADEYKEALSGMSCHFGTYEVDVAHGTITFHIDRASYPNLDETSRTNTFTLHDGALVWHLPKRPDGTILVSAFQRMP